jgi:hypothetical protein
MRLSAMKFLMPALLAMPAGRLLLDGPDPLVVKQFTLRDSGNPEGDDPMVRGEIQRRLYGAVSNSERRDRLGQYFTVIWNDASGVGQPVELVFDYQQASTGARVKREVRGFDPEASSGQAEFQFIGEPFREEGRVLAWRAALVRGGKELASEQSYLWE